MYIYIWYPPQFSTVLVVVAGEIEGFRGQMPTCLGYFLVFASFNLCTRQPFPVFCIFHRWGTSGNQTPDWIQSARFDPIGWKVFKSSCPQEKFMRWCMEMQVSKGVLHGVLNGEFHEECMLWWMEKWCRGCQHKMGCVDARLGAG